MTTQPLPDITDVNRPYWDGLVDGQLRFQSCTACGHNWLPAREHCPECLSDRPGWHVAQGAGKIVSWVVYRTAYAPHLATKIPYNVAIVELVEGPRMLTNILGAPDGAGLTVGAQVQLVIQPEGALHLPRFALSAPQHGPAATFVPAPATPSAS
jgi:uncharacterized protein